jgi:rubredoxin
MVRRIDKNGYYRNYGKLEHRDIYQTYYHCCLLKGIDLDHINGDKTDNRIENLRPVKKGQHSIIHHKGKKYRKTQNRICIDCGTKTSPYKSREGYELWNHINENWICRKCYSKIKKTRIQKSNLRFGNAESQN